MHVYQYGVDSWMRATFTDEVRLDYPERNYRFLEEALELAQSGNCTREDALRLVDYVYGRPVGDLRQEVGGVMVTLAALCTAHGVDMQECGNVELARNWVNKDKIAAKAARKTIRSPLPGDTAP
jgi:hypothetical protein